MDHAEAILLSLRYVAHLYSWILLQQRRFLY